MKMVLSVADAVCLDAVRKYAAELARAGLPVQIEELAVDDGWTEETAVSIEWGSPGTSGQDWELDDDLEEEEEARGGLDDGQGRLAEHYLRTVHCLARDAETARKWLGRSRRSRGKKPR